MQSFQLCLTVNNYHTLLFFTLPIPLSLCLRVDLQGNYGKLCCNFAFCYWFSCFIKSKGFSHENTCPTFSLSSWNFELVYIFQIQLFYIFGLVNTLRQILLILKQSCKVLEIFFLLKCYFCCFWYILKLWNECCQKVGFRWIWHNVIKKPPTKIVLTLTHDILNFVMNRLWCIHWMYAITFYFLLY